MVYNAQLQGDVQRQDAELELLAKTSTDRRLASYATSVLRSLRGGAILGDVKRIDMPEFNTVEEEEFAEELNRLLAAGRDGDGPPRPDEVSEPDDDGFDDELNIMVSTIPAPKSKSKSKPAQKPGPVNVGPVNVGRVDKQS